VTVPLPANGDTSWDDWAAYIDGRVAGNGTAGTPTTRSIGTGALEAAAGSHTHTLAAASETVQGIVELATAAETTTGTSNTLAVHPAGLKVELDKKQNVLSTQTTQTGATYTLVAGDLGTVIEGNSATAQTFTLPPSVFAVGASGVIRQIGAGQITVAAGAGVTINSRGAAFKTAGQWAELVWTCRASNIFVISGDITT
jgi:hypothetical protein